LLFAKEKVRALKREMTALWYAAQSPKAGWAPRLVVGLALTYALSPIDLIPDFIPVLGYLDDLLILPALLTLALKLTPADVLAEAREKAAREPLTLRRNWPMAVVFVLVWIAVIGALGWAIYRAFASTPS